EQVLEGVTVPESWRDPDTQRYHALAVLNRMQAAVRLRQDISALDAAAETLLNRTQAARDPFTRAGLAMSMIDNQRRRAAFQGMLRAVDASGNGMPPRWSLAQLEADLQDTLSKITLRAEGDAPWREMLAGVLADAGFSVGP